MRWQYCLFACVILVLLPSISAQVQPASQTGSFILSLGDYQVQGQLVNAVVYAHKIVTMTMSLDYTTQTKYGPVIVTGTGDWYGTLKGTSLQGVVYNVIGSVQLCYLFFCGNANYVGYGVWHGTLSGNQGSGTFQGVITFTSSQIPNVQLNKPNQISGTWESTFQTSS
jgi:hypothetical protein